MSLTGGADVRGSGRTAVTSPVVNTDATAALSLWEGHRPALQRLALRVTRCRDELLGSADRNSRLGRLTPTDATGFGVTLIVTSSVMLSTCAVIEPAPADTPVTSPLADTVAMPRSSLDQVTGRLGTVIPLDVFGVPVSC